MLYHTGRHVIPPRFGEVSSFEDADSFSEGRASVCVNGKYGHIDTVGQWITPAEYEAVGAFSQGFAVVKDKDFGYVDRNGVECTAPLYLDARPFREGLAWVRTDEGWGVLEIPEHVLSGDTYRLHINPSPNA